MKVSSLCGCTGGPEVLAHSLQGGLEFQNLDGSPLPLHGLPCLEPSSNPTLMFEVKEAGKRGHDNQTENNLKIRHTLQSMQQTLDCLEFARHI